MNPTARPVWIAGVMLLVIVLPICKVGGECVPRGPVKPAAGPVVPAGRTRVVVIHRVLKVPQWHTAVESQRRD